DDQIEKTRDAHVSLIALLAHSTSQIEPAQAPVPEFRQAWSFPPIGAICYGRPNGNGRETPAKRSGTTSAIERPEVQGRGGLRQLRTTLHQLFHHGSTPAELGRTEGGSG